MKLFKKDSATIPSMQQSDGSYMICADNKLDNANMLNNYISNCFTTSFYCQPYMAPLSLLNTWNCLREPRKAGEAYCEPLVTTSDGNAAKSLKISDSQWSFQKGKSSDLLWTRNIKSLCSKARKL